MSPRDSMPTTAQTEPTAHSTAPHDAKNRAMLGKAVGTAQDSASRRKPIAARYHRLVNQDFSCHDDRPSAQ